MSALRDFLERHGLATGGDVRISRTAGRTDLCALFHDLGYRRGAEIGVWQGHFAQTICRANPGVTLLCVDPWHAYADYGDPKNDQRRLDDAYRQTVQRLAPYGCEIVRATSTRAADRVAVGSLDFCYIDANHGKAYVLADLHAWAPKVRSGGVVAGHDYEVVRRHAHLHVKEAVDEYARLHKIAPIYVLTTDKTPTFFWMVP